MEKTRHICSGGFLSATAIVYFLFATFLPKCVNNFISVLPSVSNCKMFTKFDISNKALQHSCDRFSSKECQKFRLFSSSPYLVYRQIKGWHFQIRKIYKHAQRNFDHQNKTYVSRKPRYTWKIKFLLKLEINYEYINGNQHVFTNFGISFLNSCCIATFKPLGASSFVKALATVCWRQSPISSDNKTIFACLCFLWVCFHSLLKS